MDLAVGGGGEFFGRCLEYFCAASADIDCGSEFEKTLGHGFAQSGAAAGDENAFGAEKVGRETCVLALTIS